MPVPLLLQGATIQILRPLANRQIRLPQCCVVRLEVVVNARALGGAVVGNVLHVSHELSLRELMILI